MAQRSLSQAIFLWYQRPHLAYPEEVVSIQYLHSAVGWQAISPLQHQTRGKTRSCSSPLLYSLFVNDLLVELEHSGLGVRIDSVPRLSRNVNMYRMESLVSFLCKHDVIKIGLKQKGNVLRVIQPTMLQRSVCMIFDAQ